MLVLGKADIINMICGVDATYETTKTLTGKRKKLYSYKGGFEDQFKWEKEMMWSLSEDELLALYTELTCQTEKKAYAVIKNERKEKAFYHACSNCGKYVGKDYKFCPECGKELIWGKYE